MQRLHDEASRDALQRMRDESLARLRVLRDEQRLALERYQVSSFSEMKGASPQEEAPGTAAAAPTATAAGRSEVAATMVPMPATVPTPTTFSSTVEALGVDPRDPASVPSTATAIDVAGPTPGSHEYDNSVHVLQLLFDHLDSDGTANANAARQRHRRTPTPTPTPTPHAGRRRHPTFTTTTTPPPPPPPPSPPPGSGLVSRADMAETLRTAAHDVELSHLLHSALALPEPGLSHGHGSVNSRGDGDGDGDGGGGGGDGGGSSMQGDVAEHRTFEQAFDAMSAVVGQSFSGNPNLWPSTIPTTSPLAAPTVSQHDAEARVAYPAFAVFMRKWAPVVLCTTDAAGLASELVDDLGPARPNATGAFEAHAIHQPLPKPGFTYRPKRQQRPKPEPYPTHPHPLPTRSRTGRYRKSVATARSRRHLPEGGGTIASEKQSRRANQGAPDL